MKNDVLTEALEATKGVAEDNQNLKREIDVLATDVSQLRKLMGHTKSEMAKSLGKSGAEDLCVELSKIAKAVIRASRGDKGGHEKAAALMDISTDARGGYIITDTIASQLDLLALEYGELLGKVRYVQQEAGVPFHQPVADNEPTSAWVVTEGGTMTEMDVQIGDVERTPKVLGGWIKVSNELMFQSQVDFGAIFAALMVRSNVRALETAIIQGDDTGTDPSDGLLVHTSVNDGTDLATPTQALLMSFVQESIGTVPSLYDKEAVILTSPQASLGFVSDSLTSAYTSLFNVSNGALNGGSMKFHKWDFITSPAAYSTTHRVVMFDPSKVFVPRWRWVVDIDPYGLFTSNQTRIRALMHCNYGLSYPAGVCKADITALS